MGYCAIFVIINFPGLILKYTEMIQYIQHSELANLLCSAREQKMLLASVSHTMTSDIHVLQCSIVHCYWLYGSSNEPLSQRNPDVGVMSQQLQTSVELNSQIYQLTKVVTH